MVLQLLHQNGVSLPLGSRARAADRTAPFSSQSRTKLAFKKVSSSSIDSEDPVMIDSLSSRDVIDAKVFDELAVDDCYSPAEKSVLNATADVTVDDVPVAHVPDDTAPIGEQHQTDATTQRNDVGQVAENNGEARDVTVTTAEAATTEASGGDKRMTVNSTEREKDLEEEEVLASDGVILTSNQQSVLAAADDSDGPADDRRTSTGDEQVAAGEDLELDGVTSDGSSSGDVSSLLDAAAMQVTGTNIPGTIIGVSDADGVDDDTTRRVQPPAAEASTTLDDGVDGCGELLLHQVTSALRGEIERYVREQLLESLFDADALLTAGHRPLDATDVTGDRRRQTTSVGDEMSNSAIEQTVCDLAADVALEIASADDESAVTVAAEVVKPAAEIESVYWSKPNSTAAVDDDAYVISNVPTPTVTESDTHKPIGFDSNSLTSSQSTVASELYEPKDQRRERRRDQASRRGLSRVSMFFCCYLVYSLQSGAFYQVFVLIIPACCL